jgi:hypothetical protein
MSVVEETCARSETPPTTGMPAIAGTFTRTSGKVDVSSNRSETCYKAGAQAKGQQGCQQQKARSPDIAGSLLLKPHE